VQKLDKLFLISLLTVICVGASFIDEPVYQFICFQLVALMISLRVVYILVTGNKAYISFILPLITNANGSLMLSIYTLLAKNDIVYNNTFRIHYLEHSFTINLAFFIPPIVIYLCSRFIGPKIKGEGILKANKNLSNQQFLISLVVVSFFFFRFFSDVLLDIPFLGYLSRVGTEAFLLFTFWLGYWNFKLRWVFYIGIGVVLLTTGYSVLSGGRFYAFIQLGALFVGYVLSQPLKRRKFLIRMAVVSLPVLFSISGTLSFVRNQIGRGVGDIEINADRLDDFIDAFSSTLSQDDLSDGDKSLSLEGMKRSVKWPNLSVMALSPDQIPYRGVDNLGIEFSAIFQIAAVSSGFDVESVRTAREANIELGLNTGMANKYGYNVNRMNSVEWGLLADAWSRGGPLIYMLYFGLIISLFSMLERKMIYSKIHPAEKALLIVVLVRILWFNTSSDPLYYIIRTLILSFSLSFAVIIGIRLLTIERYQKVKYSG